jgi:hypothetical protein
MKMHELIRDLLNVLDGVDDTSQPQVDPDASPLTHAGHNGDDINRFKQIVDLVDAPEGEYCNEPDTAYAGIDSVTINAGGGINGPKHPADIRVKDPSATPHLITQPHEPTSIENPEHIILIKKLGGM